jgi:ribosomal protein L7/L12
MKATISLTKPELLVILSSHYGFTVVDATITTEPTLAKAIREVVEQFDYRSTQKIAAIKALRTFACEKNLCSLGLADAKWAIENFATFIAFVEKNDRLPADYYSNGLK